MREAARPQEAGGAALVDRVARDYAPLSCAVNGGLISQIDALSGAGDTGIISSTLFVFACFLAFLLLLEYELLAAEERGQSEQSGTL